MAEHNSRYILLLSHKEMVRDLLLGFVKADWVQQLDLESLERDKVVFAREFIEPRRGRVKIIWVRMIIGHRIRRAAGAVILAA